MAVKNDTAKVINMSISVSQKVKRLIAAAILLAFTFTSPAFVNLVTTTAAAASAVDAIDYVFDSYDGVSKGHVFDSVTLERLVRVLRNDGKSIVLLGSPTNATSQASLKYINDVAKDYGIQKIYLFDPNLGGADGADITDPTKPYSRFWELLKTYSATNGALLKYINNSYTSDSTYLFVYDRKAGGDAVVDSGTTILSDLLITNSTQVTGNTNAFKSSVTSVLASVGAKGSPTETRFSQFDYFKSWTSGTSLVTDAHKDGFRLQEVTYPELINILETTGTHNILFSGSWCPDSKAAIGYIAENSARYNSSPVYVFDFRLDGGLTPSTPYWHTDTGSNVTYTKGLSVLALETALHPTGTGYLGAKLINLLTPYNAGHDNVALSYFPDGDSTKPLTSTTNIKFRSPFLVQYDKDAKDTQGSRHPVVKEWIHQLADYEVPNHSSETGSVGSYIDYELSSGYLTNAQKALGRAALGTFFSGKPITYTAPKITISETDSEVDSGCGDDNDPVNNLGDDNLIPNHGTNSYDVKNYDIKIQFDPEKITGTDSFTGNTVIKAVAAERLNSISLDFRALPISAITVKNLTLDKDVAVSSFNQVNQDELDNQKLIINLATPISANESFQVDVSYTTGTIDAFVAAGKSPQGFSQALNGTGGTAIGEPFGSTYWFPNNNTPKDGATYKITLIAPSAYTSISNGKRISNVNNSPSNGLRTRVFEVTQETAPYQIFASFSNDYTELAQTVTLTDGSTIDALSYVNKTIYDKNDNRNRDKTDTFFNKLPLYIRQLEAIAGAYPGESAGFVFDNLSNGAGGPASWGAVETKDRPFFTSSGITGENTFVHEYAHQWFGDSVRIASWKDLWLNEGFATYVTDLYYENTQGVSAFEKYKKLYENTGASSNLWKIAPADIKRETDLFGGAKVAYNRGALTLSALRAVIGDENFFNLLKEWTSRNAGKAVTTQNFIALAKEVSKVDLDAFFQAWLYGTTKPASFPTGQVASYTITVNAGSNGSVSPSTATVSSGGSQVFTITPNSGYEISDVKVDGTSVGKVSSYTFANVTANHSIEATFKAVVIPDSYYTISVSSTTGGTVTPNKNVSVKKGESQTFTFTPNSGYTVDKVL
ncbi:MAG: hypothetical protein K0R55_3076, partial [Sporomusa sp.]|nr:hypothetical protein [Sporomusa sp.]